MQHLPLRLAAHKVRERADVVRAKKVAVITRPVVWMEALRRRTVVESMSLEVVVSVVSVTQSEAKAFARTSATP
jgi:hypothetical protein